MKVLCHNICVVIGAISALGISPAFEGPIGSATPANPKVSSDSGFTTKFYLFTAVAQGGLLWLVALAITNSVISLYYYMMIMKQMYMVPAEDDSPVPVSALSRGVLGAMLVGIIAIGVYPAPLVDAIDAATRVILP